MVLRAGRKLLVVVRVIVLIRLCDVMRSSIVRHHVPRRMSYPSTLRALALTFPYNVGNFIIG